MAVDSKQTTPLFKQLPQDISKPLEALLAAVRETMHCPVLDLNLGPRPGRRSGPSAVKRSRSSSVWAKPIAARRSRRGGAPSITSTTDTAKERMAQRCHRGRDDGT
ncbi:MAG TPA: hypothetical protein VFV80_11920 [Geminicoccaceae bacterium]|nr:hypothetical protein [Geminicoccaceae bacterium]